MKRFIRQTILANIILLMALTLSIARCKENTNNSVEKSTPIDTKEKIDGNEAEIDLYKLLHGKDSLSSIIVDIDYDPYFNTKKQYKGFLINDVIALAIKKYGLDTTNKLVFFECKDGYAPFMDISKVVSTRNGYIVFKDMDEKNAKNWNDSLIGKFSPYYLVWKNLPKDDASYVWPFGLTKLTLTEINEVYNAILPTGNQSVMKGFDLFTNTCIRCHSINQIGGTMGPEFNGPKNITEYWKEDDIINFAKDPKSYRYNSRMPPITKLSDADFRDIISYLKHMKMYKL